MFYTLLRNNMLRLTAAIILISVPALAQTKDTDGWGKVKWGMTVEQAKSLYGDEAKTSTVVPGPNFIYIDRIMLSDVKIGDVDMIASLQTPRGSEQIKQVAIALKADMQAPTFVRSGAFDRLKSLVIEKYGAPTNEDRRSEGSDVIKTLLWSLPTTTITLLWNETPKYPIGYVTLTYKAIDKKALDVL